MRECDLGKKILKQTLTMLLGEDCQLPHFMQMDSKSFLEEESEYLNTSNEPVYHLHNTIPDLKIDTCSSGGKTS